MLVAIQLSVLGLYFPPVFNREFSASPPQIIISLPLQTAVWELRAAGALAVLVAVQLSVAGEYLPPLFERTPVPPPHTIISLPVQMAV